MANEIEGVTGSGETVYALVFNASNQIWNGSAFETYTAANYANYLVTMTEVGSTGIYIGSFPSSITTGGTYRIYVKKIASGSAAQDDGTVTTVRVDWTGTTVVTPGAVSGTMIGSDWRDYVLRGGFKRTDKDTELYEETTDAIQELRREFGFDEAEADQEVTDVISSLGTFKMDVEDDFGLLINIRVQDGQNATPLIHKTKAEFDKLYPDINVTADRGYPKHFTIYAGEIWIGPIPDQITYTYREAYSKRAGTITGSSTSVPFTGLYRDILRDNVTARLYKLMDDFEKSNMYRQYFVAGLESMKRRERRNSGVGMFNVTPLGM